MIIVETSCTDVHLDSKVIVRLMQIIQRYWNYEAI